MLSEQNKQKCILVTSALPEEGKSFIAANLAATYANHGFKTVLVDCDLRRPSIHEGFKLKNDRGLISMIEEKQTSAGSFIDEIELSSTVSENGKFHCLKSGGSSKSPTELIQSDHFEKVIENLKREYDIVVMDTSPAGFFPDALLLSKFAGEILLVLRHHKVSRSEAKNLLKRLEDAYAPVIGVVVNAIQKSAFRSGAYSSYGYGNYHYKGYYSEEDKPSSKGSD